jgi:hypothetical protein
MKRTLLYILPGLLLAACVYEDLSECPPAAPPTLQARAVLLRVRDIDTKADITDEVLASLADGDPNNDMIRDVGFYTFNADGTLRGTYVYATPDMIRYPLGFLTGGATRAELAGEAGISDAAAWVSAWANVTHEYIDDPHNADGDGDGLRAPCEWLDYEVGSAMADPIWSLTRDPRYGGDPTARICPGEMWFGLTDMLATQDPSNPLLGEQEVDTLWIEVKNAILSLEARGLPDDGSQYYFLVRKLNSGYDFNGSPVVDDVQVYLDGVADPATGRFTAAPQYMIHSAGNVTSDNATVVDLYRRASTRAETDVLVFSTQHDDDGALISLRQGVETHISMDAGSMDVTVTYKPWRERVIQNVK